MKIPSRKSGSKRCSTIGTLSQNTPINMTQNSRMMIIPPTWHKRDLNANMHGDNMSIPSIITEKFSKKKGKVKVN